MKKVIMVNLLFLLNLENNYKNYLLKLQHPLSLKMKKEVLFILYYKSLKYFVNLFQIDTYKVVFQSLKIGKKER